ncbi:MAG: hypothetical protein HKM89_11825 [Gemmatimonadales bacterium]|nr:hypothetical protein [Gemmatimonadales bacterium]
MKRLSQILLFVLVAVTFPLSSQIPAFGTGSWEPDSFGNHRAVVHVPEDVDAVWVRIDWRRRDLEPEKKDIIIVDSESGARIRNIARITINREYGDLVFQPVTTPGDYYVYYLPYVGNVRSNYPKITYREPESLADADWLERHGLVVPSAVRERRSEFSRARLVELQSIDEFNSFLPMEVIATAAETRAFMARYPMQTYLVFPEDRTLPIRMNQDLPFKWIQTELGLPFQGTAQRGEFYTFQLGVFAARQRIDELRVTFGDLTTSRTGFVIPASAFTCFNLGGIDWQGRPFTKQVTVVERGTIQPLWCGVQIPDSAGAGLYRGQLTVAPVGLDPTTVELELDVTRFLLHQSGDDEPWRLSRLRWLNSRLADDDGLVPPYTQVRVQGGTVSVLGRQVMLGANGLPARITSFFAPEMTRLGNRGRDILSGAVSLVIEDDAGREVPWEGNPVVFVKKAEGAVAWEAKSKAGSVVMDLHAEMEFDGNIEFTVALQSAVATSVNDIRLDIPIRKDVARYAMGMGLKEGFAPPEFDWTWRVEHNQDGAWIGDINAGLQFRLRDDKYSRPLNTNFYLSKPLVMPASWDNGGKGGCQFRERDDDTYLVTCYSGPRTFQPGEVQHYDFLLLVTPFKPLDPKAQWSTRFFHAFKPLDSVAPTGANTINVHHATDINPWINYPFLRPAAMKAYIDDAHARDMKVKIYYTVRELTNKAPELFALKSLGDEIFSQGDGGGFSWLQEHLDGEYIAAWHVPRIKDAAIINTGISRWHNFYVEGLNWLVRNVGIDGLYIDDVAFDRSIMKRVRKVLTRNRTGALIDLHSANQFNERDGFANSANLYLEHFPFIDRLWFGEYFDYDSPPEFWLVEMSGIPFGLMGEMLQDGGNPWRGMVFGMTSRLPWAGDPRPLWKLWDEFGIQDTRMLGYWVPDHPVTTGRDDVLATAYVRNGATLVALASWAEDPVTVRLAIDWSALGIAPASASITAPAVEGLQESRTFGVDEEIPVEPGKGWLIEVSSEQ